MILRPILVSSCLLGLNTRYDGSHNHSQKVIDFLAANHYMPIPICPEQLAGMTTPRPKCWFSHGDGVAVISGNGKLCNETGQDVTGAFIDGAQECLKIAKLTHSKLAILQQRSPSCGSLTIHLNQKLVTGVGVTSALLHKNGVQVFSVDNLPGSNF